MVMNMKKKFIIFLCILAFPLNVLAYSSEVILGGKTIGIDIKNNGVMIIGFYDINNKINNLREGDIILKVGNTNVYSISELTKAIENNMQNKSVELTVKRENKEIITTLNLKEDNGTYVKDSITGIGTLTFIDPASNIYGALGHEIEESNTSKLIEVKTGTIFKNNITNITKSNDGAPGSKNAKFYYNKVYGDIDKNTKYGIYGKYSDSYNTDNLIEVANKDEIKIGKAEIYTVVDSEKVEKFEIYITKINETSDIKNMTFEITDKNLINKTGGIVQGMSGSPIVQNGKLVGAVTHVITDNVKTGYGLFITTMLEESER